MLLSLKKVGKIKEATININGLTVIAGKNDTGKSTVGKVLYAVCRALGMYTTFFDDLEKDKLVANTVIPLFKKYIANNAGTSELAKELASLLEDIPNNPYNQLKVNDLTLEQVKKLLSRIKQSANNDKDINVLLDEAFSEITKIEKTPAHTKLARTLRTTLRFVFAGEVLNSKYHETANLQISVNNNEVVAAEISNKGITANINEILVTTFFKRVLYAESPLVLENIESAFKPHWYEMQQFIKRWSSTGAWNQPSVNEDLLQFIQKQIFGDSQIVFDEKNNTFRYQVDNTATALDMQNVAFGMKSFSLIFLLLKLNLLTKGATLLILDEPENHLHPEWQIKYAEMICLMVSKGFSIVLTSHSPTFIQALEAYGRKFQIQDKASFYLAEKIENENYSRLTDVTSNTERIAENLIEPMDKLFLGV